MKSSQLTSDEAVAERDQIDELIERLGDVPPVTAVDPLVEAIVDRIGSVNRRLTVKTRPPDDVLWR